MTTRNFVACFRWLCVLLTKCITRPLQNNRDIMPILNDPNLFSSLIDVLANKLKGLHIDRVLGIESRGFLIGPMLAQRLRLPFGPIRKKGKLPGELYSVEYELEYGRDILQVQKYGLPTNSKCLIVDDLIATGGSLEAAAKLVKLGGGQVAAFLVVIELEALQGKNKLSAGPLISLFKY